MEKNEKIENEYKITENVVIPKDKYEKGSVLDIHDKKYKITLKEI